MRRLHAFELFRAFPFGTWLQQAEALLDQVFPEACAACAAAVSTPGALLCGSCTSQSQTPSAAPSPVSVPALAPFAYHGPVRDVVRRFKFEEQPHLARRMACNMLPILPRFDSYPRITLVPVPLHPARLASRGYNQSALLAGALAFRAKVGFAPRALARINEGRQQAQLSAGERRRLQSEDFALVNPPTGPVVLIDDVFTTGSTARACIEALQRRSVLVVGVLTFAQVEQA